MHMKRASGTDYDLQVFFFVWPPFHLQKEGIVKKHLRTVLIMT